MVGFFFIEKNIINSIPDELSGLVIGNNNSIIALGIVVIKIDNKNNVLYEKKKS